MASGWNFLAGFANTLGGRLEADHELEQKQKLMQMQQDAEMKRQQFLDKYRSDLEMERDKAKDERQKDDVVGTFKDPETGSWFGRTRSGGSIPLHATSEEYQGNLKDKMTLGNEKTGGQIDLNDARVVETGARTKLIGQQGANIESEIGHRNAIPTKEDPINKDIRSAIKDDIENQRKQANAKRAEMLKANPQADLSTLPSFDQDAATQTATALAYERFGAERVKSAYGAKAPAPDQKSPTQPGAPSMEALMQQANDAIKRGAPADKVEARLKEAMAKYGYQPQPVQ